MANPASFERFTNLKLVVGSGHFSEYQSLDNTNGESALLKIFRPYFSENQEGNSRFFDLIETLQGLNHTNVDAPISFGQFNNQIWVASSDLRWKTLSQIIENRSMSFESMKMILNQLATTIDYLHSRGIRHGNLTPENVLISDSGELKISQFGVAELVGDLHPLLRTTIRVPDPHYSDPQQLQTQKLSNSSDLYSIGVLIYEMLTGRVPYPFFGVASVLAQQMTGKFTEPSELNSGLNPEIDDVIVRILSFEPVDRFSTAFELDQAVGRALAVITSDTVFGAASYQQSEIIENLDKEKIDGFEESNIELNYCPSCGRGNEPTLRYCQSCWNLLVGRRLPSRIEAQKLMRTFTREWRKNWLLRRTILAGSVLIPLIYVLSFFVAFPVSSPTGRVNAISGPHEWVNHGNGFKNTSYSKYSHPIKGNLLWKFETTKPLTTSPTADERNVYVSTADGRVSALDIIDGSIIWETMTPTPVDSTPVLTEEAIYFGLRNGEVWALNIENGERLWRFKTGNPVFGSGQVYEGVLYIGSGDGFLYALDASTGKKLWDYDVGGWVLSAPILYQDLIGVATSSGWVWVIDITNGKKKLSYKTNGSILQDPVSVDDKIIVGNYRGKLTAINWNAIEYPGERGARYYRAIAYIWGLENKAPIQKGFIWSQNFGRTVAVNSPAVAYDHGYVVTSDGKLRSININTGEEIWTYNSYATIRKSSPVIGGDTVYIGTDNGFVHAINRSTGREINRFFVGGGIVGQLVIANSSMFISSTDGTLYAYR